MQLSILEPRQHGEIHSQLQSTPNSLVGKGCGKGCSIGFGDGCDLSGYGWFGCFGARVGDEEVGEPFS